MYDAKILKLEKTADIEREIAAINVCKESVAIMKDKALFRIIKLTDVRNVVANILKQEMLACGGDAAVSMWTVDCSRPKTDVLLMGTLKQYARVITKMRMQSLTMSAQKKAEYKAVSDEIAQVLKKDL